MPGRVARGGARSSARTARTASPATEIPDEGADTSLRRAICTVFSDSQKSTAGHRKCLISLRKIQEACCYEPVNQKKGKQDEDFEEEDFNGEFAPTAPSTRSGSRWRPRSPPPCGTGRPGRCSAAREVRSPAPGATSRPRRAASGRTRRPAAAA